MSESDVSRFMHLLTSTHARRWRKRHGTTGLGAVYQGRFRCVLVQDGYHLAVLLRYVERNALRAGLVRRAEDWRWCSLAQRLRPARPDDTTLAPWPADTAAPADWLRHVNDPLFEHEQATERIRTCIRVQAPFGTLAWTAARWRRARDPADVARLFSRASRSAAAP
jgi:putative transposase